MANRDEMPVRCSGCAFTVGTEAYRDDLTVLTAELCAQGGEPFFCHANAIADKLPKGKERVCRGYIERTSGLPTPPAWKRAMAVEALRIMEEATEGIQHPLEEVSMRMIEAAGGAVPAHVTVKGDECK